MNHHPRPAARQEAALLEALEAAKPAGVHPAEAAAALHARRSWVYARLAALAARGDAERVRYGRWRATRHHPRRSPHGRAAHPNHHQASRRNRRARSVTP